jgi:hypothetical protein
MRVVQHPSNNAVLGAPAGQTVEQCRPAPITRLRYGDGSLTVVTYWHPTDEEREAIASGALIRVEVAGYTMAPMNIGVDEQ